MQTTTNDVQVLMIPDDSWFGAPDPRTWRFFPVFTEVARALHQALRDELPRLYFRDPARFANVKQAYPMLVYQSSRPSSCRTNMFCHDVLDPVAMDTFFRMARGKLVPALDAARVAARAAGLEEASQEYEGRESRRVLKCTRKNVTYRKPINTMLVVEAALLHELIAFSGLCVPQQRARRIADFTKSWNVLLRRFCGNFDFTAAAPALLNAATAAFIKAQEKVELESDERAPYDWAA